MTEGVRVAVLTVSDSSARREREDLSGPATVAAVKRYLGWDSELTGVVPDERPAIESQLRQWADESGATLILTTGGTGFAPRDVTPEATRAVIEREAPGLVEAVRAASLRITPHAMLSRAVAGLRGRTLIVNLPGNPKAVREALEVLAPVLPHALALLSGSPEAESRHRQVHV